MRRRTGHTELRQSLTGTVSGRMGNGLVAGVLATAVEAIWSVAAVPRLAGGRDPVMAPRLMARRLFRISTGRNLEPEVASALGALMRAAYGPSWAVAWTLLRPPGRAPLRDACLLGSAIWAFEITALPLVRATPPLRRWPRVDILLDLSNAAVFAAATSAVLRIREGKRRRRMFPADA